MRNLIDLMEAQAFLLLETPQRAAWLLQNFGPKLEAQYAEEVEHNAVPDFTRRQIEGQPGVTNAEKLIQFIMAGDPTTNKSYSRWIALRYMKDKQKLEDIGPNLAEQLSAFQRGSASRRIGVEQPNGSMQAINIDTVRSFGALYDIVAPFIHGEREVSNNDDKKNRRDTATDTKKFRMWDVDDPMRKQAKVIYDGDDYMIVTPKTHEASRYFGNKTNWCTSWESDSYYNDYTRTGPLFIILRRQDSRRWQFHFSTCSFMNERDQSIDLNEWIDENPVAFKKLGIKRFAELVNDPSLRRQVHPPLNPRHFEGMGIEFSDDYVVSSIVSLADIMRIDAARRDTEAFFEAILPKLNTRRGSSRWDNTIPVKDGEAPKIVAYYMGVLKSDAYFFEKCDEKNWLFGIMPVEWQTDDRKIALCNHMSQYADYDRYLPKPWPVEVETRYWNFRMSQDPSIDPVEIPERFRDRMAMARRIAKHPESIPHFLDYLDDEYCEELLRWALYNGDEVYDLIKNLPMEFRKKKLLTMIYDQAKDLKRKDESEQRDWYLRAAALFPEALWPWKASKIINRMAMVNPDFYSAPEQFQTPRHAAEWVKENPKKLATLKKEDVDAQVVGNALAVAAVPDYRGNVNAYDIRAVLEDCDPDTVKLEYVATALKAIGNVSDITAAVPPKFMTGPVINSIISTGKLPFDSELFPSDGFTPENVVARFKSIPARVDSDQTSFNYRGQRSQVPNIAGFTNLWNQIPVTADRKAILEELVNHEEFRPVVRAVDASLLDQDILTAYVESARSYDSDAKGGFDVFPTTAYTPQNIAMALEKGIISKSPDGFDGGDDVLVKSIRKWSADKNVDWDKVTSEVFNKVLDESVKDAAYAMQFRVPAKHPIMYDAQIALRLLTEGKDATYYSDRVDAKMLIDIYGEHRDRRKNWMQECFDNAAGDIVAFEEVPARFRSDAAKLRAIKTAPVSVNEIDRPAEFLDQHDDGFKNTLKVALLAHGLAKTTHGWVDVRKVEHEKVAGSKGSYAIIDLGDGGRALMIFNDNGLCIDALLAGVQQDDRDADVPHWQRSNRLFADSDGHNLSDLAPFRLLIADAIDKHPDLLKAFPSYNHGHGGSVESLKKLRLYKQGSELVPVEKLKRETLKEGTLTYVQPEGRNGSKWNDSPLFIFDGREGKMVMAISLNDTTSGAAFSACQIAHGGMGVLVHNGRALAEFMRTKGVTSGGNPTFKESALFMQLGLRGPGKGEWFTLLDEKVIEAGDLSVWKYKTYVSVASSKDGILAIAKKVKGAISVQSYSEGTGEQKDKIDALFQKVKSKL